MTRRFSRTWRADRGPRPARVASPRSRAEEGRPVERWGIFEVALPGPSGGNPFVEVDALRPLHAGRPVARRPRVLRRRRDLSGPLHARVRGRMALRDAEQPARAGRQGGPVRGGAGRRPGNHGPGPASTGRSTSPTPTARPYFPIGTTCYAWTHQGDSLEEQTLATLKRVPVQQDPDVRLPQVTTRTTRTSRRSTRSTGPPRAAGTSPGSTRRSSATSSGGSASSATWGSRPT